MKRIIKAEFYTEENILCQCETITQSDERRRHIRRRNDGLIQALFIDSQTLHAREQGGTLQPQPLRRAFRPGHHAVGLPEHAQNELIFILSILRNLGCGHGRFRKRNLRQGQLKHVPARQQHRALDDVFQLAHVPRPLHRRECA